TALLLNRSFRGRSVFRAIIILPYGVATVVSAIAFTFVFSPTGWYANEFIIKLGLVHADINWTVGVLGFLSVAIADSWKTFPLIMLILLGGLQMIPDNLYEAAAVDGASQIQQFRHITLPNLYPFIMIALIIRAVSEFNILALPLILVGRNVVFLGTMSYSIYETFSVGSSELSASAATILLGIILVFVIVYVYISNRMVGDQSAE
ncbi:MAG: carbohydrate ABC transporter permease, partial [Cuniculiplasma sp.]